MRSETIVAAILGTLLLLAAVRAPLNDCGVPVGEACGTDSECECMHPGAEEDAS